MDALRKDLLAGASLSLKKDRKVRFGKNFGLLHDLAQTRTGANDVAEKVLGGQPAGLEGAELGL